MTRAGEKDAALFGELNARVSGLIEKFRRGDFPALRDFSGTAKPAEYAAAVEQWWKDFVGDNGSVKAHQMLGTPRSRTGRAVTFVRVEYEKATKVLRLLWFDDKMVGHGSAVPRPAVAQFHQETLTAMVMKQVLIFLLLNFAQAAAFAQQQADPAGFDARCSPKLVPYADWPKVKSPNFLLDLTSARGRLYYFGAGHSADPGDPQFPKIEKAWEMVKPTVAFYEGPNRPIAATKEETIKQAGESGFVRFLATRDGIPFLSLEPPPQDEAVHILKQYSPEQVMLFYVLRETARLRDRRKLSDEELKKTVAQLLERASKLKDFEGVIPNIDALGAAYRKYWSEPAQWWQAPGQWFDPLRTSAETGGKFTNEINRLSSEYRNLHMYRVLANAVLRGERVFAVVGGNHIPMQEPALRCALQ